MHFMVLSDYLSVGYERYEQHIVAWCRWTPLRRPNTRDTHDRQSEVGWGKLPNKCPWDFFIEIFKGPPIVVK